MSCSDRQMLIASKIAYIDFNQAAVDSGQYTVRELLQMELESAGEQKRNDIQDILGLMESGQGRECGDWVLKDIGNDQRRSGMYACMLETGAKEALVTFRGSEDMSNPDHLVKDWIGSDLGLLNSALTPQQAAAEQYINKVYKKYGDKYESFSMTGHSLGGNLAEHAAITAPDSMRNRIDRCLNLDGPGFSQTYIAAHAGDIAKSRGLLEHYQWSAIGTLLNTIPGSSYQTVKAETPDDKGTMSVIWRHDTNNIKEYDSNGSMIPGDKDWLSRHTKEISNLLDYSLCMSMGSIGLALLYNYADMAIDTIKNRWEEWRREFSQGGRACFMIQTGSVYAATGQLHGVSETIKRVREETNIIRKNLPVDSVSGGYIKYKLWRIENSMERLAGKIHTYASKGEKCAQLCQKADCAAAGRY